MHWFGRWRAYITLAVLLLATLGIWVAVLAAERPGVLTVAVLNVGQGDAIYIQSPTGVEVLIDGGPDGSLLRELPKVMKPFDRHIDAVIETHPDADHISGLVDLIARYEVAYFIDPGLIKETVTWRALEEEVAESSAARHTARRGDTYHLGGGATLFVLFPEGDVSGLSASKSNEGGVVMQLVYGEASMLFMADVSNKVEMQLVALDGAQLNSDLLKVGHHGSRTSTGDAFVKTVTPAAAIISVGGSNRYGHPTNDVLNTLSRNGVEALRTDTNGTVIFTSNGGEFVRMK